jgi:hypothetical protein
VSGNDHDDALAFPSDVMFFVSLCASAESGNAKITANDRIKITNAFSLFFMMLSFTYIDVSPPSAQ